MERILRSKEAAIKRESRLVKLAYRALGKAHSEFFAESRILQGNKELQEPHNKYYKIMVKIINYLEDLRGEYTNPLELMLDDYFIVAYRYFHEVRRMPYIGQLSTGSGGTNCVRFETFIGQYNIDHDPFSYWITCPIDLREMKRGIKKELQETETKSRNMIKKKSFKNFNVSTIGKG